MDTTVKKRLRLLLILGPILVCSISTYVYFWQSRPTGIGPAGPAVSREAFEKPWTDRTVLLVGLGDSVTAGFGARPGYSYFDLLALNSKDDYRDMLGISLSKVFPHFDRTNMAVSGSISLQHEKTQLPRLAVQESNVFGVVVISTGGNDIIHNYGKTPPKEGAMYGATWDEAQPWIANYEKRLDAMMTEIESRFPGGCFIFLANIYDPTDGVGDISSAYSKWKNRQYTMDARFKIKKNFTLSSRFGQSVMKGVTDRYAATGYLSRHVSISSQLSGKLFTLPHSSNVTFGLQQMDISPVSSLLINMNINQSIIVNTHVLTVSVLYNKDLKNQALYGNLLTAESAWSYLVWKKISCTSGLTYLNNKEVVEQVGVKQTVTTALLPRLNVNLYVDCRQNLVNTAQNYLFGNFNTQLALHYLLN